MRLAILLLLSIACCAQTYAARTDVTAQAYPATLPGPGSGCSAGTQGCFSGQNYSLNPSDFPGTPLLRATDVNTPTSNSSKSFSACCGGSAESNPFDVSKTRLAISDGGAAVHMLALTFNPFQVSQLYTSYVLADCGGDGSVNNAYASFTQSQIYYAAAWNSSKDPVICTYNVSSGTTGPTVGNGGVTQLMDASTCVGALAGVGTSTYLGDVSVSGDDQTFAIYPSASNGQGSGVYVIIWNRTNGCRVWNTSTGAVTGAWGTTGTVNISDTFYVHNLRISKSGTYAKVTIQSCISTCATTGVYIWNIATLTVLPVPLTSPQYGGGHTAIGYNDWVNNGGSSNSNNQPWDIRACTTTTPTFIPTLYPGSGTVTDGHWSWANDNSSDTAPFLGTFSDGSTFTPTTAWNSEIVAAKPDGSATYRFAHTYSSNQSNQFSAQYAIGSVSQDGLLFAWTTDWDGLLGNTDGVTSSCTIGTNCRSDVFIANLPLTGVQITGAVTISGSIVIQ